MDRWDHGVPCRGRPIAISRCRVAVRASPGAPDRSASVPAPRRVGRCGGRSAGMTADSALDCGRIWHSLENALPLIQTNERFRNVEHIRRWLNHIVHFQRAFGFVLATVLGSHASSPTTATTRSPTSPTATVAVSGLTESFTCRAWAKSRSNGTAKLPARSRLSRLRRRAGRWQVCFSVRYEPEPLPALEAKVGIEVGLEHFAALSTGDLVANPRWYKSAQRHLRR